MNERVTKFGDCLRCGARVYCFSYCCCWCCCRCHFISRFAVGFFVLCSKWSLRLRPFTITATTTAVGHCSLMPSSNRCWSGMPLLWLISGCSDVDVDGYVGSGSGFIFRQRKRKSDRDNGEIATGNKSSQLAEGGYHAYVKLFVKQSDTVSMELIKLTKSKLMLRAHC